MDFQGFRTVCRTSDAFSTPHSCGLNLLSDCVYRSNGSWKFCLLLVQKSQILVLCEEVDTVSESGHPVRDAPFSI